MRRLLFLLVVAGCAKGDKIAELEFAALDEKKATVLQLQRGDRLELWEDYELTARDTGKSFNVFSGDRCFRWSLQLGGGQSKQSLECWAQGTGANCTHSSTTPPGSGSDCRVKDCSLTAEATGPMELSALLSRPDDGCPRGIRRSVLRVRRVRE